jgi:hypothetical protein
MNSILQDPEVLKGLIAILSPLVVAGVRLGLPKVPSKFYPIIAAVVGILLDTIAHYTIGTSLAPWVGATLGLAGVGLREAKDQLTKPAPVPPQD